MLLDRLKTRLKSVADAFTDVELQMILDGVTEDFSLTPGVDDRLILDLATAEVYLAMATDTARYFKWRELSEEVDRTKTPEYFLKLYQTLWDRVQRSLPEEYHRAHLKRDAE